MTFIPNLATATSPTSSDRTAPANQTALRQAAAQFESLLLTQLTASLNPKEDAEDALFSNSGGGMGLARQMYSEQLAKTMSASGGIGIADMIMAQANKGKTPLKSHASNLTERALSTARELKSDAAMKPAAKTISALGKGPEMDAGPNVTDRAASTARELNSNAAMNSAARTSSAPGKATNTYSDPIIISEAFPSSESASLGTLAPAAINPPASSIAPASTSLRLDPNDLHAAIGATRPRRFRPESVSTLSGRPAIVAAEAKPALAAVLSAKNVRPASAYVSFQAPVQGAIRSEYGMRRDPINGRMRLHQGIDIAAKRGTPIEAAAAGTVVFAGKNKGYGNMVMIEHADGRRTLYAHAQALFVKAGDTVATGQTIAAVGSTGHSTGPHLHFEVRERNRSVNPLTTLSNDIAFARR